MEILLIIGIVFLFFAAVNSKREYDKAKGDEIKRAEFMNNLKSTGIAALITFGLFGACVGCLKSHDSSSSGSYHNRETGEKQIQYQGSREQQKDLNDIDNYARDHPVF